MAPSWPTHKSEKHAEGSLSCLACLGSRLYARYGLPYGVLWQCKDCGSGSTAFFDGDTLTHSNARWGDADQTRWRRLSEFEERRRAKARLRRLRHFVSCGSLLEIGPNRGEFLAEASELGFRVCAADLFDVLAPEVREQCAKVYAGDFLESQIESRFDVIAAFHVLEHVPSPRCFIRRARELVTDGGHLYIEVPNYDSIDRLLTGRQWGMLFDYHVSHFSRRGLVAVIEAAGFVPCSIRSYTDTARYLASPYSLLRVGAWKVVKRATRSAHGKGSGAFVPGEAACLSRRDVLTRIYLRLESAALRALSVPLLPLGAFQQGVGRGQVIRVIARAV